LKIAALLNQAGETADLQEEGSIYIFERNCKDEWLSEIKLDFTPVKLGSMEELRSHIGAISRRLGDCKVLAAKTSIGFCRVAFESFGVALWALEGSPRSFIGAIEAFYAKQTKESAVMTEANQPPAFITPVAGKAGHYAADLRNVMAHKAGLNSKEILLPFFKSASFTRLELDCDHIPRWFDQELPALNLRADAEFVNKTVKVVVSPQ
jgi:Fe-only nitrogenase accessory protein AnfO